MVSAPICANKVRMVQPVPTKAVIQPAAMCMASHAETRPPLPIAPFLLVQNPSSKQIASTDNMWPKSDPLKGIVDG